MFSRWPEFEAEMQRGMGSALPENLDDFAACIITKKEDIYTLFVPNFFFGCESDDPTLNYTFAAKVNPFGAKLGTSIVPTFPRHPLVTVQQTQVIASLASGRFRLGVGPSHRPLMAAMGLPFRAPLGHLREYVRLQDLTPAGPGGF